MTGELFRLKRIKNGKKYSINKKANGYCLLDYRFYPGRIKNILYDTNGFYDLYTELKDFSEFRYDSEYKRVDGCKNLWEKVSDHTFRVEKKN